MFKKTKVITIRVPIDLLNKMSEYREKEGVSVTFQLTRGAEKFLKEKGVMAIALLTLGKAIEFIPKAWKLTTL